MCTISSTLLNNATWAALVCSSSDSSSPCSAICANPDLSGIGVRVAFYLQSFLNTLLVIFSPGIRCPKGGSAITLHHATLVLNFATLSCISSLVVAPILPIWQLTPEEYCVRRLALDDDAAEGAIIDEKRIKQLEAAQSKERLILALALLTQVVLQWAWAATPNLSSSSRNSLRGRIHDDKLFFVWVLWLLFSLGITLFMTIVLAVTSGPRSQNGLSRHSTFSSAGNSRSHSRTRAMRAVYASAIQAIPSWNNRSQLFIFCYNILAFALWLIFIVSSELQIRANCIFQERTIYKALGR
ncbi:hypothetical protein A0H81_08882 [Grifola frondosa]|uniref:Uncharacterized protein n=1 Tax=Grifola frondosa TaxID=5627 RepID=A0A1C7M421_GRIFR|nr:hypothetical protein A0H81_08882 [Grifola frondosa]